MDHCMHCPGAADPRHADPEFAANEAACAFYENPANRGLAGPGRKNGHPAGGIVEIVIRQVMRAHYEGDLGLADLKLSRLIAEALRTAGLLKYAPADRDDTYYEDVRRAVGRGAPTVLLGTPARALRRALGRMSSSQRRAARTEGQ